LVPNQNGDELSFSLGRWGYCSSKTCDTEDGSLYGGSSFVKLRWSGVENPQARDWISAYCPATGNAGDYIDWFYIGDTGDSRGRGIPGWESGRGSATFRLYNMRCAYEFFYVRNAPEQNQAVATNRISFRGPHMLHTHIALTAEERDLSFQWNSALRGEGKHRPFVRAGTAASGSYTLRSHGVSTTYTHADMCDFPATSVGAQRFRDVGYFHEATLRGLVPNTRYVYQVCQGSSCSVEAEFTTPPVPGPNNNIKFTAWGDMGAGGNAGACDTVLGCAQSSAFMLQRELERGNRFHLHFGDLSYGRSRGYLWEQFMSILEPTAKHIPYMVSVGNHEHCYRPRHAGQLFHPNDPSQTENYRPSWGNQHNDAHGECSVPAFHRFKSPRNPDIGGGPGNGIFWYSFNFGNLHIVQMSSEHNITRGSPMMNWMEADLKAVDRSVTPWVIVTNHRPMYTSENYRSDFVYSQHMQRLVEDVLHDNEVDLFLAGQNRKSHRFMSHHTRPSPSFTSFLEL
jgi:hypothetical protein